MECQNCSHWQRIEIEGAPGGPKNIARPGWGNCYVKDLTQIRVKGFLETSETFHCKLFQQK